MAKTLTAEPKGKAFPFNTHAGTDLDLNKASHEFFSEALRKTRSMCKQKRSLVCKQQAHAGTDLVFSKSSEVIEDCRNQTENIA